MVTTLPDKWLIWAVNEKSPVNTRVQVDGAKRQTHRFERRGQIPDTFLKLLYTNLIVSKMIVHEPDCKR